VPGEPSPGLAGQPRPEAVDEASAEPDVAAAGEPETVVDAGEPAEVDGEAESTETPDEVGAGVGRRAGEGEADAQ
jgi:hypothetical protein